MGMNPHLAKIRCQIGLSIGCSDIISKLSCLDSKSSVDSMATECTNILAQQTTVLEELEKITHSKKKKWEDDVNKIIKKLFIMSRQSVFPFSEVNRIKMTQVNNELLVLLKAFDAEIKE